MAKIKNLMENERFFENNRDIDIIGGPQLTPKTDGWFARVSGYALESYFGTSKMSKRYKVGKLDLNADENSLTSANCFARRSVFKKIDSFNVKLYPGEDPEFFARAKKNRTKKLASTYKATNVAKSGRRGTELVYLPINIIWFI